MLSKIFANLEVLIMHFYNTMLSHFNVSLATLNSLIVNDQIKLSSLLGNTTI